MQSGLQHNGLRRPARLPQRKQHVHANVGAESNGTICASEENHAQGKKLQPRQHQRRQPGREYK
ncbi:MAG: hypothetical protein WCE87_05385, partial [Candidatus Udaeobacter sp.]